MALHLRIFDPDAKNISGLKSAFTELRNVTIEQVDRMLYLKPPAGLDVLYLPLAAAERFGSRPLIHESQILPTKQEDQRDGLPPFVVSGTCLAPNDPRGPVPEMTLLLGTVFRAIRAFNHEHHNSKLTYVGFWAYDLLKGVNPSQLRRIVVEIVPELLDRRPE